MIKLIGIEFKKIYYSKLLTLGLALVFIISLGISIIEFKNIDFGSREEIYVNFMLYNTSFAVIKFFIPIIMLILVALVWGGEYDTGLIKTFMLCGSRKIHFYFGKMVFLIIMAYIILFISFGALTLICYVYNGFDGISIKNMLNIAKVYALSATGLIPIILITIFFSIILDDFQKSVAVGLVMLLLSLSADSILLKAYLSPTYFLSNSQLVYYSIEQTEAYAILVLYAVISIMAGMVLFNKKDIWS